MAEPADPRLGSTGANGSAGTCRTIGPRFFIQTSEIQVRIVGSRIVDRWVRTHPK